MMLWSTQRRVIRIPLGSGRIKRIHIRRIHRRARLPSRDQVRVGKEWFPHGDQIAFVRNQIALGACGIIAAGEDQRALE